MFISYKLYLSLLNAIDEKYIDKNYTKKQIQYMILNHYFKNNSIVSVEDKKGNKRAYTRAIDYPRHNTLHFESIIKNYWDD